MYNFLVASSKVSYCWHQKCSDCSDAMFTEIGIKEKCDLKSIISTTWLDSEDDNTLDIISNEHLIEFVCLKMIAYDPITGKFNIICNCFFITVYII